MHWMSGFLIALFCVGIALLPTDIQQRLSLTYRGLVQWELWRLFTGHFVHTNIWHLALNLAGLVLTWLLFFEHFTCKRMLFVTAVCTFGLSLILLVTGNLLAFVWYVGLSGTLHGIFAFALVLDISSKQLSTYALIILGLGKLMYEQLGGATADTAALIGANVAINAHLWGAVLGVVAGLTVRLVGQQQKLQH